MQPTDYYALMKFKMQSTVIYKGASCKITGWSTNGNNDIPTFCYQLNNGGVLVQETDLLLENTLPVTDAASTDAAVTPA